jgi:N-acetylneuraminic acid mutarotase
MSGNNSIISTCVVIVTQISCGESGVYGTLGVPSASNFPGGREWTTGWVDHSGNIWLFGGWGFDSKGTLGFLNDLWELNPSTKEWTWVGGSDTTPSLYDGRPGIYGTLGTPASTNLPGSRYQTASWTDPNGNFWMFGGVGYDAKGAQCYLNDLWVLSPATKEWAWRNGSSSCAGIEWGQPGVYGTLGTPAPGNVPGSRQSPMSWTDNSGNLWLFGGYAFDVDQNPSLDNDLWEYTPSTGEWTWMSGYEYSGIVGSYGTLGVPSPQNLPGPRTSGLTWTDHSGNLWLLGGSGNVSVSVGGVMSDLWEFSPSTKEWTWQGGSSTQVSVPAV